MNGTTNNTKLTAKSLFMRYVKILTLIFSSSALFSACSYDNLEEYYSEIACDTVDISFSSDIYPMLERNCLGCHFDGNSSGVELESYDDLKEIAESGRLLGALKHLPGYEPMPRGGKLDDCSIRKFEIWTEEGALDN